MLENSLTVGLGYGQCDSLFLPVPFFRSCLSSRLPNNKYLVLCLLTLVELDYGSSELPNKALDISALSACYSLYLSTTQVFSSAQTIFMLCFLGSLFVALICASSVSTAPTRRQGGGQMVLSSAITSAAGGDVPNAPPPPSLTSGTLSSFQVAEFLENLESAFFQAGVKNLTVWGTQGYPANTLDVVARVAAVSSCPIPQRSYGRTLTDSFTARTSPRRHVR